MVKVHNEMETLLVHSESPLCPGGGGGYFEVLKSKLKQSQNSLTDLKTPPILKHLVSFWD